MDTDTINEITLLRSEINDLRSEIGRCLENTDTKRSSAALQNFRKSCADTIIMGEVLQAKSDLESAAKACPMKEKCVPLLSKNLTTLLENLRLERITAEDVAKIRREHEETIKLCKQKKCAACVDETNRLFDSEVKLLKTAGVYTEGRVEEKIHELSDEGVATWIGEPLANIVRVKIMKSLASEPKSFADLVKLTGLRGGNLLFHLEKLTTSGMIQQKGERKDYVITSRGFELLTAATELMEKIS